MKTIVKNGIVYTAIECPDCVQSSGYVRKDNEYVRCSTCPELAGVVLVAVLDIPQQKPILRLAA
jgi:hypothetical protein